LFFMRIAVHGCRAARKVATVRGPCKRFLV
jgi:hypothetical protein